MAGGLAPEFFSGIAKRMSIPDEDLYPDVREVEGGEARETLPEEASPREEAGEDFRKANSDTIGYYDESGNPITAEGFERLFSGSGALDD